MLPQDTLSDIPLYATFVVPQDVEKIPLIDRAYGGIDLDDPTQGLRNKIWTATYNGTEIVVSADGVLETAVVSEIGVADLSFTFDQNMRVAVAYEFLDGRPPEFLWYDTTVSDYVTLVLPVGTFGVRCKMDDTRDFISGSHSDIILTYMRGDSLYHRTQRERYLNEYLLESGFDRKTIGRFGLNYVYRMQWEIKSLNPGEPGF